MCFFLLCIKKRLFLFTQTKLHKSVIGYYNISIEICNEQMMKILCQSQ